LQDDGYTTYSNMLKGGAKKQITQAEDIAARAGNLTGAIKRGQVSDRHVLSGKWRRQG
jgi:hypothetical protein